MKVEILNIEECRELFKYWGLAAAKCYDTPKKFAERIGKSCLQTEHYSGSRGRYIIFEIDDVPRALVDQIVRHEQGVFKNVESGRYVNFSEFDFYIPPVIYKNSQALRIYVKHMEHTKLNYANIVELLKEDNITGEKAYEAARGIMPMNYNTSLVIGFTVEALINLMNKRLCVCSQDHIMKLAKMMKEETLNVIPELKDKLVPVCESYGYCPENEKRSCKKYPQRKVADKLMDEYRKNLHFKEMIDRKVDEND